MGVVDQVRLLNRFWVCVGNSNCQTPMIDCEKYLQWMLITCHTGSQPSGTEQRWPQLEKQLLEGRSSVWHHHHRYLRHSQRVEHLMDFISVFLWFFNSRDFFPHLSFALWQTTYAFPPWSISAPSALLAANEPKCSPYFSFKCGCRCITDSLVGR